MDRNIDDWKDFMTRVFTELKRVLKKGGFIALKLGGVTETQA
jgi:DNA modification methylase